MLANINLLEYIDLIPDWGSSSCLSPAKKKACVEQKYCYMAGNFFPTARALIGYFEVTWHMTSNNETVSRQKMEKREACIKLSNLDVKKRRVTLKLRTRLAFYARDKAF